MTNATSLTSLRRRTTCDQPTHPERRIPIGHAMEVSGAAAAIIRVARVNPALVEPLREQLSRIRRQLGTSEAAQAVAVEFRADHTLGVAKPDVTIVAARMGLDADYVRRTAVAIWRRGFDFCDLDMENPGWLPPRREYVGELARRVPPRDGDFKQWNERIVALDEMISRLGELPPINGLSFDVHDALTFAGQAGIVEIILTGCCSHAAIFKRLRAAGFRVSEHVMEALVARLEGLNVFKSHDE